MISLTAKSRPLVLDNKYTLCFNVIYKTKFYNNHIFEKLVNDKFININNFIQKKTTNECMRLLNVDSITKNKLFDYNSCILFKKNNNTFELHLDMYDNFMNDQYNQKHGLLIPYKIVDENDDKIICKSLIIEPEYISMLYKN